MVKLNEMESALAEVQHSDIYIAMKKAEERRQQELEELSKVPVILAPERTGYVRKNEEEAKPFFVIKLTGPDNMHTIFPVDEQYVSKFSLETQKYEVEYEMTPTQFVEAVQWIDSQSGADKWSVKQKVFRKLEDSSRPAYTGSSRTIGSTYVSKINKTLTVFSFSCDKAATLFKMFQT